MKKTGNAPECLTKLHDISIALDTARTMLNGMKLMSKLSIDPEIQFLEDQIRDMEKQKAELSTEAEKIIGPFRNKDIKLYMAIKFHYFLGIKWEDAAESFDTTDNVLKHRVYRAFDKLEDKDNAKKSHS